MTNVTNGIDANGVVVHDAPCQAEADLLKSLKRANDVLRSAFAIAEREGRQTNWPHFLLRVEDVLYEQHRLLNADHDEHCQSKDCKAWRLA